MKLEFASLSTVNRFLGKFFLLGICLVIAYLLFSLIWPLIQTGNQTTVKFDSKLQELDNLGIEVRVHEISENGTVSVSYDGHLIHEDRLLDDGATIPTLDVQAAPEEVCAKQMHVSTGPIRITLPHDPDKITPGSVTTLTPTSPFFSQSPYELDQCFHTSVSDIYFFPRFAENGLLDDNIRLQFVNPPYLFPFDKRSLNLFISLEKEIKLIDGTIKVLGGIAPQLELEIDSREWTADVEITKYIASLTTTPSPGESASTFPDQTHVHINFERPLASRILTVIILGLILGFIFLLVFINEVSSFLEVAIAILLGLWGVQDILIPDYITGTTVIHTLILTLYVLIAFAIFIRFVIKPVWYRLDSQNIGDATESAEVYLEPRSSHNLLAKVSPPISMVSPRLAPPPTYAKRLQLFSIVLSALAILIGLLHFTRRNT